MLAPSGEASMPNFYASKVFLGAAAVSARGIFQADAVLVASQRRFLELADEVILLVDSNKFTTSSGGIVCKLDAISTVVTNSSISNADIAMLRDGGINLVITE
ncbi:MAG: hypothetical protein ABF280_05480 [Alteriqipengyuania sp.]